METVPYLGMWSIIANIVSVLLGFLAIALVVYFFLFCRKTETAISRCMTQIETQAGTLEKLTGFQLFKIRNPLSEYPPTHADEIPVIATHLTQIPRVITHSLQKISLDKTKPLPLQDKIGPYIILYYYIAQANYWSQHFLPSFEEYDESVQLHLATKRIVDASADDFARIEQILSQLDINDLHDNPLFDAYRETQDFWRNRVRSSSDVYIARQRTAIA